jgi:hypothetical protein
MIAALIMGTILALMVAAVITVRVIIRKQRDEDRQLAEYYARRMRGE